MSTSYLTLPLTPSLRTEIYIISISTYILCTNVASTALLRADIFIKPSSSGGLGAQKNIKSIFTFHYTVNRLIF